MYTEKCMQERPILNERNVFEFVNCKYKKIASDLKKMGRNR